MSLLFMDGFDAGDFLTKWNVTGSTLVTSSTSTPYGSGRSVQVIGAGELERPFTASAQITMGFAVLLLNGSSVLRLTIKADMGETTHLTLVRNTSNGFLELRRGGSTLIATGATSIAPNSWYYIEVQATVADSGGTVKVRINGVSTNDIDFTGDTRNSGTSTNIDTVKLDSNSTNITIDDFYVLNSLGTNNTTFLGNVRVHTLAPNANGTYSQLTGSDGNQIDNYQLTDELPFDTADYVASSVPAQRDTYGLSNLATGITQVLGLQSNFLASKTDASQRGGRNTLLVGGGLYYGASRYMGLTYRTYSDMFESNPATSAAWTKNQVDDLESGVEVV